MYIVVCLSIPRALEFSHTECISETQDLYATASRRCASIDRTSSVIEELVKDEQRILREGLRLLAPGISTLDAVDDPGSITDISGNLQGPQAHIERQLARLAHSTIYHLCRFAQEVKLPLEKLLITTRHWQSDNKNRLPTNPEALTSRGNTEKLIDTNVNLKGLVRRQLDQLTRLLEEFVSMKRIIEEDGRMMKLLRQSTEAQDAIERVKEENAELEHDAATDVAINEAVAAVLDSKVSLHRPSIIPLIEKVEGIVSQESIEMVLRFLDGVLREHDRIDTAVTSERSLY